MAREIIRGDLAPKVICEFGLVRFAHTAPISEDIIDRWIDKRRKFIGKIGWLQICESKTTPGKNYMHLYGGDPTDEYWEVKCDIGDLIVDDRIVCSGPGDTRFVFLSVSNLKRAPGEPTRMTVGAACRSCDIAHKISLYYGPELLYSGDYNGLGQYKLWFMERHEMREDQHCFTVSIPKAITDPLPEAEVLVLHDDPVFICHRYMGNWKDVAAGVNSFMDMDDLELTDDCTLDMSGYGSKWICYRLSLQVPRSAPGETELLQRNPNMGKIYTSVEDLMNDLLADRPAKESRGWFCEGYDRLPGWWPIIDHCVRRAMKLDPKCTQYMNIELGWLRVETSCFSEPCDGPLHKIFWQIKKDIKRETSETCCICGARAEYSSRFVVDGVMCPECEAANAETREQRREETRKIWNHLRL